MKVGDADASSENKGKVCHVCVQTAIVMFELQKIEKFGSRVFYANHGQKMSAQAQSKLQFVYLLMNQIQCSRRSQTSRNLGTQLHVVLDVEDLSDLEYSGQVFLKNNKKIQDFQVF